MATILFHGEPIQRRLLRQRIAADRLEPLAFPLGPEQAMMLIDVSPNDAWLPLSIEMLNGLRRLWRILLTGPGTADRTAQEVHAYVILRTSLLAALRQRQTSARICRIALDVIPEQLPTSSRIAHLSDDDRAIYDDAFERIEGDLIVLGVANGVTADPRTVHGVTRQFADALDRIEHGRAQRVLDRALIAGLTSDEIHAYKRRTRMLWQRITSQEDYWLAYAIQIVARIGEIWDLLGNEDGGWHRHDHDEEAYQAYRHLLLRGLDQPESGDLHALALDLLPNILPSDRDTSAAKIRADMPSRLERLRSEIISLAVEQDDPVTVDLATQPGPDETFEEESWIWSALKASVSSSHQDHHPTLQPPEPTTLRQNGRPRAKVTYEQASALYWHMYEEFDGKTPTQVELAERLTHLGKPLKDRTFRTLIAQWRTQGKGWPPPAEAAESSAA